MVMVFVVVVVVVVGLEVVSVTFTFAVRATATAWWELIGSWLGFEWLRRRSGLLILLYEVDTNRDPSKISAHFPPRLSSGILGFVVID